VLPTLINGQPHRLAIEQQGSLPPQQLRSIASSIPYLAAKPAPSSSGSTQPQQLRIYDKYATHKTFYSTQINPQYDLFTECQYPQLWQHPTSNSPRAVPQQQLPQQYYGSALAVHSTPALTAPNIQLPNSFMQYPSVATHLSSKPLSSTRLSIQTNTQQPRAVLQPYSNLAASAAPNTQ